MKLVRHPKMIDVAMQILSRHSVSEGKTLLIVNWWNVGKSHKPFSMDKVEHIEVQDSWLRELVEFEER